MNSFLKSKKIPLLFLIAGALAGFLYWRFVGCVNGTCPIRSVWYWTTIWGATMGYLTGDLVNDLIRKWKTKAVKKQ